MPLLRELGAHYHAKAQAIGAAEQLLEFLEAEVSEPASGAIPPGGGPHQGRSLLPGRC